MLKQAPIVPYIPVADMDRARKFYEEKVGLKPRKTHGAVRQVMPITLRRCLSTQCLTSLATRDSQADVDSF